MKNWNIKWITEIKQRLQAKQFWANMGMDFSTGASVIMEYRRLLWPEMVVWS